MQLLLISTAADTISCRACISCNHSKTRCDGQIGQRCSRCSRLGLDCVWAQSRRGKSFTTLKAQLGYVPPPQIIAVASTPGTAADMKGPNRSGLDASRSLGTPGVTVTLASNHADELQDDTELPPSLTRPVAHEDPHLFANQADLVVHDEPRRLSSLPMPGDSGNNPLHALAEASRMASGSNVDRNGRDGYFRPNDGEAPKLTEESARRPKGAVEPPHVLALISKAE